jgi:serine/threonine-protein kinase
MTTGTPPFTGDSAMAVAYKHVQETPLPPSSLNGDVPPALDAVVMRALAKNPANRYQSAGEFRDDLLRVIAGHQVEATPLLPPGGNPTQVISRPPATAVLPPPEPDQGGRKAWLWVLIGALILLILGGGAYLLAQSLLGEDAAPPVIVPDVVGDQFEDANEELTALGLDVAEPEERVDANAEPGEVLAQSLRPNVEVEEGTEIVLTIARAPRTFPVPDLTGATVAEAEAILAEQGLQLGSQSLQSSDQEEGLIISQDPLPNDEVERGTPVNVVVSSGPEITTVSVPDVTCLSFGQAKAQLTAAGLQINDDGTAPINPLCSNPNKIAAQDPPSGEVVDAGTVVNVYFGETASPTAEPT